MDSLPQLFVIKLTAQGYKNPDFAWAVDQSIWGFKRTLKPSLNQRPTPGDIILMCSDIQSQNGVGRVPAHSYDSAVIGHIALAVVMKVYTSPPGELFWPSEVDSGAQSYVERIQVDFFGEATDFQIHQCTETSEPLRLSGINGSTPHRVDADHAALNSIAKELGFETWSLLVDSSRFSTEVNAIDHLTGPGEKQEKKKNLQSKTVSIGQGWMSDSAKKRAIEKYAVEIATDFYLSEGWRVTELGKPYDLRCIRGDEELHVEVKGTTGLCTSVSITYNEFIHAHEHQTDLFIVSNIVVETNSKSDYQVQGGESSLVRNWRPTEDSLKPISYKHELASQTLEKV